MHLAAVYGQIWVTNGDMRANLIDPKLNRSGWTRSQVTHEHYYRPNYQYKAVQAKDNEILTGG